MKEWMVEGIQRKGKGKNQVRFLLIICGEKGWIKCECLLLADFVETIRQTKVVMR